MLANVRTLGFHIVLTRLHPLKIENRAYMKHENPVYMKRCFEMSENTTSSKIELQFFPCQFLKLQYLLFKDIQKTTFSTQNTHICSNLLGKDIWDLVELRSYYDS